MSAARSNTHAQAVDAAIELFTRKGYEQTTVEDIADAAQISRATFFRRFRSKEDVVFADHELLLDAVVVLLGETRPAARGVTPEELENVDPYVEVCKAARLVFDHHVGQRETSVARHRLLQDVPALRDRELVTTHRYERAFTSYLRDTLPADTRHSTASVAFAASVVAVHNAILRRWLRDPDQDLRPELEEAFADLRRAARNPAGPTAEPATASTSPSPARTQGTAGTAGAESRVGPAGTESTDDRAAPAAASTAPTRRVVVTVLDGDADPDEVARAVRDALGA